MVLSLLTALGFITASDPGPAWVPVAGNGRISAYASRFPAPGQDSSSLWILVDFGDPQPGEGLPYRSVRTREEYDCRAPRHRTHALIQYSDRMGRGSIVYTSAAEPGPWLAVEPGTVFVDFRSIACTGKGG